MPFVISTGANRSGEIISKKPFSSLPGVWILFQYQFLELSLRFSFSLLVFRFITVRNIHCVDDTQQVHHTCYAGIDFTDFPRSSEGIEVQYISVQVFHIRNYWRE